MKHLESKIQQNCVKWFNYRYPTLVLFAIPNGGRRGKVEASIMKGEGVLSGVADLFLMTPNGTHHGLFIELKTPKGKQTEHQKRFEQQAKSNGYQYEVCRSLDEFMNAVANYLAKKIMTGIKIKPEQP